MPSIHYVADTSNTLPADNTYLHKVPGGRFLHMERKNMVRAKVHELPYI